MVRRYPATAPDITLVSTPLAQRIELFVVSSLGVGGGVRPGEPGDRCLDYPNTSRWRPWSRIERLLTNRPSVESGAIAPDSLASPPTSCCERVRTARRRGVLVWRTPSSGYGSTAANAQPIGGQKK